MKFKIQNMQEAVPIDEVFWNRAFNYASRELQIEHHCARVDCYFIPLDLERKVKFKHFNLGATEVTEHGAMFYVVTAKSLTNGSMVKTFFHEMTHVKQLLMRELIQKTRHRVWKGEKWDRREYAFAPWEMEANTFSDNAYETFLRREVTRVMAKESVHAYHPYITKLRSMFPEEEVFRLTQELHRDRERQAIVSSPRDWIMVGS
jgi:hypothetical protein